MRQRPSESREADAISGDRILAGAHALAFPRAAGSDGDARIIGMLRQRYEDLGLQTSVEEFSYDIRPAMWVLRGVLVTSAALVTAASIVVAASPVRGAVLLGCAVLPFLVFLAWAPWLERLYRRDGPIRTANVVGRRANPRSRLTLIIMAHHDSKSQSLSLPFRAGFTTAAIAGALTLLALVAMALVTGRSPGPGWLPLAAGGATAASMMALSTLRNANRSPGGVDNAGSVAILLELARVLPSVVDDDVDLIFLSTGAEEDHMVGAMRWLDAHLDRSSDQPVYCLNFDGAGSPGRLVLLERSAMGIDAIPFAHRGVPCLTVSSGSLDRATMAVHSANDRAEHLDSATLDRAARLGFEILLELARDGRARGLEGLSEVNRRSR
jgi:acetylornithine deacetylase/succinyl-diaminopimelate desuccinylase-like protein